MSRSSLLLATIQWFCAVRFTTECILKAKTELEKMEGSYKLVVGDLIKDVHLKTIIFC